MKAFEAPAHNRAEIEAAISALAREPAGGVNRDVGWLYRDSS
jgi:hypothetical protein